MTLENVLGPLSRAVCCLIPVAWLPALGVYYLVNRQRHRRNGSKRA